MQNLSASAVVQAWQDAANRQDVDQLVALSDANIELIGPRGSAYGHQILRDWLSRAGLQLETRRVFERGDVVVVAQHAVWRSVDTGKAMGEADIASRFRVENGRVVQFARYDNLNEALAEAGLVDADEIVQR